MVTLSVLKLTAGKLHIFDSILYLIQYLFFFFLSLLISQVKEHLQVGLRRVTPGLIRPCLMMYSRRVFPKT